MATADERFEGFTETDVAGIHLRHGGEGTPLLLLHGYPQTHVMWSMVAPGLAAAGHHVVCPDLRGYGRSHKPPAGDGHIGYAKRTMAAELVAVMAELGHERFAVAGHDRGGRVAYRMALDHPDVVTRLATLDIVPTIEQWDSLTGTKSVAGYHWMLLAQPHPFPERLIAADPEYVLRTMCGTWAAASLEENMAAYVEAFVGETIRATCDDYRAGATIDVELDRADREAGRRIRCPVLVLWGDPTGRRPSLLDTWRRWAHDVTGQSLPCGHFLAEEQPEATLDALRSFFAPPDRKG